MRTSSGTNGARRPSEQTLRGLDGLNFFLADVQAGIGPFLAIYLAGRRWNEEQVGLALTVCGVAGILMQAPAGALVDRLKSKRALIAVGVISVALGALVIALFSSFWTILFAQALIGGTSSVFVPAIAAISLGVVGRRAFDRRQGRNQAFNSAGNVVAAVSAGLIGYFFANRGIFFFVPALAIPAILMLGLVRPAEIDHDLARGEKKRGAAGSSPARFRDLLADRRLLVFLACAVLFHFANAAMLPLVGQMLAKGLGKRSMGFMSACVVTTQLVIALVAAWVGRIAGAWGRKPLLAIAFGVLPVRGFLYTVAGTVPCFLGIQVLDGISAGIFSVVSVLVIADLTQGTGRFNLTLGVVTAAVGTGASLSQAVAGSIVHHAGYTAGFAFLSAVAAAAFTLVHFMMPETRREGARLKVVCAQPDTPLAP